MSEIGLDRKHETDASSKSAPKRPQRGPRATWIGELSRADGERLRALFETFEAKRVGRPDYRVLKGPEIGLVMTRGRIGGDGAPFNLGETTVTRCVVRLSSGEQGVAYAMGRDKAKAEISALCDALMQTDAADALDAAVIAPLAADRRRRAERTAREAAATKVEFFTMTRGENE